MFSKAIALVAISTAVVSASDIFGPAQASTFRYWDCCKPSCGWADKAPFKSNPVGTCKIDNSPLADNNQGTGCNGGTSFACANQSPWAVNDDLSYGFVGAYLKGGDESTWCCGCYELEFTDGPVKGKKMIVQSTNTNYDDVEINSFTFSIPGGNMSYSAGCDVQWASYGIKKWEDVKTKDDCDILPESHRPGCQWRFDWFKDAMLPNVTYKRVPCPVELTNITGCVRQDDETFVEKAESPATPSITFPVFASSIAGAGFIALLLKGLF